MPLPWLRLCAGLANVPTLCLCRLALGLLPSWLLGTTFGSHILRGERCMVDRPLVPSWYSWVEFHAWIIEDMICTRHLGIDMIIVNSETVAWELLNKPLRPVLFAQNELYILLRSHYPAKFSISWWGRAWMAFDTVLLPYGETLRWHHKIFHLVLRARTLYSYSEMYFRQGSELVIDLLNAPDPQKHCSRGWRPKPGHGKAAQMMMTTLRTCRKPPSLRAD